MAFRCSWVTPLLSLLQCDAPIVRSGAITLICRLHEIGTSRIGDAVLVHQRARERLRSAHGLHPLNLNKIGLATVDPLVTRALRKLSPDL